MKRIKDNYKKILAGLLVIIIIGFIINGRISQNRLLTDFNPKKDKIVTPQKQDIRDELTLAGSIDANNKAELRFQAGGQLSWVGVKIGDKVRKFQTIAKLNQDDLKKKLESDFNNYKTALSTFNDTQDKYKTDKENLTLNDEMKRILERSQNSLDNSVINYELTNLSMRWSSLTSPINGVVVQADQLLPGVNISPATASFIIIDPNSIYFRSDIDQEEVTKIKVGDKVKIRLDSFPEKEFDSKITYISFVPVAGQTSTVYEIRAELPQENNNMQYRLGMDGDSIFTLKESKDALVIPSDAINAEGENYYVYIKENDTNKLTKRNVKIGIETDTNTEITEGLSQNEQVVIKQK